MAVEVRLEVIAVLADGLQEILGAGTFAGLEVVDIPVVGDAVDGALDQRVADEGGEHDLGLGEDDAVLLHAADRGVGDGVDQLAFVGGQDGLAVVGRDELSPSGLAFLRALVDLRGDGVRGVVGVEPFKGELVDGGADAEGLGVLAGAGEVRLVVGGGLEQFLGAGLVERLDAVIDDAFGDEVGHWYSVWCSGLWWEIRAGP